MRVARPQHDRHRADLIDQAGQLFRAQGLAAVGVAEIGRAAGLTHGAIYSHFGGKDALAAAAVAEGLATSAAKWRVRAARHRAEGQDPVAGLVAAYLSIAHRDAPATGCAVPTLGSEAGRAGPAVAAALQGGTQTLIAALAEILAYPAAPGRSEQAAAQAMVATMTGGLILARILAADPDASRAALDAAAAATLSIARSLPCSPE